MAQLKCSHCGFVNAAQKKSCQKCGTPLPRVSIGGTPAPENDANQFRRGQIVAARYTVMDLIGRGGMACIYKVQDNTLKEAVALKTMLPEFTKEKALVDRFYNEAKIARQLTHPNIVRVHDIGMADGVMYISMELLVGRSLRGVLDGLQAGQRLPVKTALRIMDQLCAALDYAHEFTIHRDIKPENVMVLNDGTVKLMDFGISKLRADSSLTATSMVMGTPHYMSPEQLKDSRNVDARTDVYSMGVLLYEVMTGNIPTGVPKPASQITKETPPDIDRIIATCMEPDPISRYQSISELRTAVRAILDVVDSNTTAPVHGDRTSKNTPKRVGIPRQAIGAVAVVFVAAVAGAAIWQLDGRRQSLLEDVPQISTTTDIAVDPEAAEFEMLLSWARRADELAAVAVDEIAVEAVSEAESSQRTLSTARAHFRAAESSGAVADVRMSLACYFGIIDCPNDTLFIEPGTVDIDGTTYQVDPFFIAKDSVTNAAFSAFAYEIEGWGNYTYIDGDEAPAKAITFYDAQMFAAHQGYRLPTYAEWRLAHMTYPDEMQSDVGDWTQSVFGEDANVVSAKELNRLRFGSQLVTVQAIQDERFENVPLGYGQFHELVGIRCVWPVALDEASIERVLNQT